MSEILFRGKCVDSGNWLYGSIVNLDGVCYIVTKDSHFEHEILNEDFWSNHSLADDVICDVDKVTHETVGQLRYENKHGKYFDGDVYYHAGYGTEIVSEFCELQDSLRNGTSDDIGEIKGNVCDNPEMKEWNK
jgi:hypothetical protein